MHLHDLAHVPAAKQIGTAVLCVVLLLLLITSVTISARATQKKDRLGFAFFALVFAAAAVGIVLGTAHAGHLNQMNDERVERLSQASGVPVSAFGRFLPDEGKPFSIRIEGRDRTCMVEDDYSKLVCYSLNTETITK